MKTQHTPGPWHHDEYGHICAGPQIIGNAYQFELDDSDHDELPCIPNARLIAAAPELLDMVQRLSDSLTRTNDDDQRLYLEAKELITKLTDQ